MSVTADDPALPHVDHGASDIAALRAAAVAELAAACDGWRRERRCTDPIGRREPHPHPECLLAQYHHDRHLLEHGLLVPPT